MTTKTKLKLFAILGLTVFAAGTILWIFNIWTNVIPPVLTFSGLAISLLAWLTPNLPIGLLRLLPIPLKFHMNVGSNIGVSYGYALDEEERLQNDLDYDKYSEELRNKLPDQKGVIVVYVDKTNDGLEINLIPTINWNSSDYDKNNSNPNKQTTWIHRRKIDIRRIPVYVADFFGLQPDNYTVWTSKSKIRKVVVHSGEVIAVDWRKRMKREKSKYDSIKIKN